MSTKGTKVVPVDQFVAAVMGSKDCKEVATKLGLKPLTVQNRLRNYRKQVEGLKDLPMSITRSKKDVAGAITEALKAFQVPAEPAKDQVESLTS